MTTQICEWPIEWLRTTQSTFSLRSFNQFSTSPWSQRRSVYGPHAQVWTYDIVMAPQTRVLWQKMAALITSLDGQAGLVRIADVQRLVPQYDRAVVASSAAFSDATLFTDGTGWESGLLPPTVHLTAAADRGADFVVIGGLPVSTAAVLRRGDLFEIRPNGIAGTVPHLYMATIDGPTNAAGATGVKIRPRLRAGVAAGDMVVLRNPMGLFRLADEDQGALEVDIAGLGNFGLKLFEAIN